MHEVDKVARNFVGNDDTIEIYDNFPSKRKYAPNRNTNEKGKP